MKFIRILCSKIRLVWIGYLLLSSAAQAQYVSNELLLHPGVENWPSYHGDYSGMRHTSLKQITTANVRDLALAWIFPTGQDIPIKSSPLVVNGTIFFTAPEHVWAVDARSGHMLWHYKYPPSDGAHIGNRGVGMYKGWIFFASPDAHLVSLNARDGSVRWIIKVDEVKKGISMTMAPMVVGDHVLIGVSGPYENNRKYIRSIDPESGKTQWTWYVTPPVGTPGAASGGSTWMSGTFDPELNLVYWGIGNPTPVLNASTRPGDGLYTCSIVAIHPDTGTLAWHFQVSPHDTHDWDAAEVPVLVDAPFGGVRRKLLLQASRNGYYFVLDRTTGKNLLTKPFGPINWSLGVDAEGRPIPNPDKEPKRDGRLVAPQESGLMNYRSPSFDPATGLLVFVAHPSYGLYFSKPEDGTVGWAGADYDIYGKAVIQAIDYATGKIRWQHEAGEGPAGPGVLTTAGGVAFTADLHGNFLALETATGKTLWHAGSGGQVVSSPISFELDGRQYVVTSSGSVLFAWALPEHLVNRPAR
jgi:alcohol dehydrogenase (cytochrome c)